MATTRSKSQVLLLTGFEPLSGERRNPSWEIARRFEGKTIGGLSVEPLCLPVDHQRTVRRILSAIRQLSPAGVLGLGQAGGRPVLSLERVAINLVDDHRRERGGRRRAREKPVVRGGPDAYFSRLPLSEILRELSRHRIPASFSLTAGAFICNAAMYASLHALRHRPSAPAGFIHLPYDTSQAMRHRAAPSMPLDLMEKGVGLAIWAIAKARGSSC